MDGYEAGRGKLGHPDYQDYWDGIYIRPYVEPEYWGDIFKDMAEDKKEKGLKALIKILLS